MDRSCRGMERTKRGLFCASVSRSIFFRMERINSHLVVYYPIKIQESKKQTLKLTTATQKTKKQLIFLPLAGGHYGLKWTVHVTRFGQSDCSISKTCNPSDKMKNIK